MVDLDIVAHFAPVPVDMVPRAVLVEIMVAEPDIDRHVHAIRTDALLVALAELQKLRALAGLGDLAAAIVGHVAADDEAERRADARAGRTQAGGDAVDFDRPFLVAEAVQRRNVAQQRGVGLAFQLAVGAQAARHAAGMDVGDEQEGGVDGLNALAGLAEGRACKHAGRGSSQRLRQEAAPGKQTCRAANRHDANSAQPARVRPVVLCCSYVYRQGATGLACLPTFNFYEQRGTP